MPALWNQSQKRRHPVHLSQWHRWLKSPSHIARRGSRANRRRPSKRLHFEALEERCVPSAVRTLVYNEITALPRLFTNMNVGLGPELSASGNRAVFADAPGPEAVRTNDIYVINADGTSQTQTLVDSYPQDCFCSAQVDISSDGSKVISTDSVQLRSANADGSV